jgi:protein transport protein SEC61 subunit gamma-like protein
MEKIKSFLSQCKRVWHILRKPTKEEFLTISKISGVGILALGLIGFLIGSIMKIFG